MAGSFPSGPLPDGYAATRDALHRLAGHVLAPARKAVTGRIGLRPTPGGFGTPVFGDGQQLRIAGAALIRVVAGREEATPITSLAAAAAFAGVELAADPGIGHDPPPLGDPEAPLAVSAAAAGVVGVWFEFASSVLETFRGELEATGHPVSEVQLWPEHFDLGCNIDGVNFGGSPGDGHVAEPYLYVGPWNTEALPADGFWNAPFGAVLTYPELAAVADPAGAALEFLRRGADRAGRVTPG